MVVGIDMYSEMEGVVCLCFDVIVFFVIIDFGYDGEGVVCDFL